MLRLLSSVGTQSDLITTTTTPTPPCLLSPTACVQDPDASLRLAAFTEICEKVVSENIFSQYMYKTLPTANQLWLFKKYFCSQMALSGEPVLGCVGGGVPHTTAVLHFSWEEGGCLHF